MGAEHASDFLDGGDAAAEGLVDPDIEEGACPDWTLVAPELLKGLLEFPSSGGVAQGSEHGVEFGAGLSANAGTAFEQDEASALDGFFCGFGTEARLFTAADLIDRGIEVLGDMEAVEHIEGASGFGGDDLEIRLPHVRTDDLESGEKPGVRLLQGGEAALKGGLGAFLPDPEEPAYAGIDLVDDGDEVFALFAPTPMEFVDPDGLHSEEAAVFQPPLHDPLDAAIHGVPTGAEDLGGFLPRKQFGPMGQKEHVGAGLAVLAHTPGHVFNGHFARHRTSDAPGGVEEEDRHAPKRHKRPASFLEPVIAGSRPLATAAAPPMSGVMIKMHLNGARIRFIAQT